MHSLKIRTIGLLLLVTFIPFANLMGCAAGGYKITRSVARFNNSMHIVPRILVYLVFIILPVYLATMLLDVIVFNTIDFWNGTVSSQNTTYEKDGYLYAVEHHRDPLRRTRIEVTARDGKKDILELKETPEGKIAFYMNGQRRAEASSLDELRSEFTLYRADGITVSDRTIATHEQLAAVGQ